MRSQLPPTGANASRSLHSIKANDRSTSHSPPPPNSPSPAQFGSNAKDRAGSLKEDQDPVRLGRPKPVHRQNTWGGDYGSADGTNSPPSVPAISIAKTINHLLHIPSNRCCADCRSALVDSSQIHASFRPPSLQRDSKRFALSRSDFDQTRNFSMTHRAFAPPLLETETRRNSSGSTGIHKEQVDQSNGTHDNGTDSNKLDLNSHNLHQSSVKKEVTTHNPSAEANNEHSTPAVSQTTPNDGFSDQIIDPAVLAFRYAWGHGVFLCAQCAQAHKQLGDNVTVVRHVQQYHTWTPEEAHAMKGAGGNTLNWKIYEAHVPEHWKRRRPNHASSISDRLVFCRAKYEAMGFLFPPWSGGVWCEQAWQRLMEHNVWAQANKSKAADLRNIVALSLHRNNASQGNEMGGMAMTAAHVTVMPTRLIDYFCVVGSSGFLDPRILQGEQVDLSNLDGPENVQLEPRVIDCYPQPKEHTDMEFPEHVATFVLPEGCRPSDSQRSPFFFTFVLTAASGHRLYGASLRIYDEAIETQELSQIMDNSNYSGAYPSWLQAKQAKSNGDGAQSVDSSEYMDIVYLPKCLVVLSHYPFFDLYRKFLLQLYRITLVEAPLPIERFIANFSCEVPLPPQGKVEVKFGFTVKDTWHVQRPPENQLPLASFSFKPLFACLSVGNIITLVGCLLTESRVALCSRHYALLTPIAEALLSFLFPLQWQGMYIPIMPYSMLDILDAPVPFLVGLHARYLIENKPDMRPQGVVFVDVDRDIIHLGYDEDTNSPRMVPALPDKQAIKLRAKVEEYGSSLYLTPDNPKLEGNLITTGSGQVLSDAKREPYAVTFYAVSIAPLNEKASSSLPGSEELRRAERQLPRRRAVLRSVDKAYQENELLTPITGFLSEQGQLYDREPIRQSKSQKSGTTMGKLFNIRRLRSQNSLGEEEHNNHFSGYFSQSQVNQSQHDIHGHLLELEEPLGFDSFEIRNSFLRFFVSLLKNYEHFFNLDNANQPFRIEEFLSDLGISGQSYNFVKAMLKTQMFQRFLEERQNDACDPLFLFFDECIIAKQNRSKKFHVRTKDTPFLDDPSGAIKETFTPPPPSNWGLPDDGRTYQYGSFPKLNPELFGKVRVPMRWQMARSSSSLRMLQSSAKSNQIQNRAWQHELLTRSIMPGSAPGPLLWAAKSGIRTLEAAIGALSESRSQEPKLSFLSSSRADFSASRKTSLDQSAKGRVSPKLSPTKTRGVLRAGFIKDLSMTTITSAENVVLNARRISGILLHAVCKMQAACRAYLIKRRYRRFLKALRFLQCKWRQHLPEGLTEMDELEEARRAANRIQQVARVFVLSLDYSKKRASAALLQRWYRGAIIRKKMNKLERACRQIQSLLRSRRSKLGLRLLHVLLSRAQARSRGYLTRKRIKSRNERRMLRYREQIVLLWNRVHTPLSYRTKFWPMISHSCGFLRLRIAESELERLWIVLEVDFNTGSLRDRVMDKDHGEELRLEKLLDIVDHTYWRYLKVREMTGSVLLFPAEERRNKELRLAADRVEAERIQIYERLSASTPKIAAVLVTLYDIFAIDVKNKHKKHKLTEEVWLEYKYASQSEQLMTQIFPELEEASNIIFNPPSKKTLKRFRNVNPTPPRLGRSHWAHSILKDQICLNVREVAVSALEGTESRKVRTEGSNLQGDNAVSHHFERLELTKAARIDIIADLLANRKWVGK